MNVILASEWWKISIGELEVNQAPLVFLNLVCDFWTALENHVE